MKAWIIDNKVIQKIEELGLTLSDVSPVLDDILQYELVIHNNKLSLFHTKDKHFVFTEFNSKQLQYRSNAHLNAELIIKAVFGKNKTPKTIVDATAGFGSDSYIMSLTGSKILAIESNPLMYLILKDGLIRAKIENISLMFENALIALTDIECDAIYLDPMYPESKKSAKTNKNMAFLQACVGHQQQMAEDLFVQASKSKAKKIILKRPLKSRYIFQKNPTSQIKGKTARFDIYAQ